MNKEIMELREVVTKLVPLIAGKGMTVTQRGAQAYVEVDTATKKPKRVNIPNIPDNAEPDFIRAIQGFIDHEVAHVLITDFSRYGCTPHGNYVNTPKAQRFVGLHNIVEDTMIEREMTKIFPGSKKNIHDLRDHFIAKITAPAVRSAKSDKEAFEYLLVPVMRALAGHDEFQDYLDREKLWDNPYVKELVDNLPADVKRRLPYLTSTAETYDVTVALENVLYPVAPPPPPPAQKGPSQDKPDQKAGEGDGDGERDHSDKDEDDDQDAEDGDRADSGASDRSKDGEEDDEASDDDSAEQDSGSGDGDPADEDGDDEESSKGDGSDTNDDGEDEEDEGNGASDDDDADDEAESDSKPGKPSSEDDEGDDAEDADGEADGAGASDDEDGDEDGAGADDEGADEADGDDDAASDAGGGESEGKDDAGKAPSAPEKGGDRLAVQTDDHEAGGAGEAGDEDQSGGGGVGNGLSKSIFDFEDDAFESADLSSQVAILILNEAVDALAHSDYNVYTREFDRIEVLKTPENINSKWVPQLEEDTRQMTGKMSKDIERMMASQSHVVKVPGFKTGRLHAPNLHRLLVADDRIFNRKQEHKSKDTAVMLLIDNSGSMMGAKIVTAMVSGFALASTLERVSIANEIIGFTTGDYYGLPRSVMQAMNDEMSKHRSKGLHFHRTTPISMPIYKTFDERINSEVKKRIAYMANAQVGMGSNIDGESLEYAATRLMKRMEKRKVMLVLSDGQPAGASNVAPHLKMTVEKLTKMGIDLVGIGINDAAVRRFYPNHIVLNNVNDLPTKVMQELKVILTN